jgi:hypothetical protein
MPASSGVIFARLEPGHSAMSFVASACLEYDRSGL